ncbi:hypothetical protein HAX54_041730, partial [Datura stramonium]|nr:hypothetical protein [Datura stramonium]
PCLLVLGLAVMEQNEGIVWYSLMEGLNPVLAVARSNVGASLLVVYQLEGLIGIFLPPRGHRGLRVAVGLYY